MLSMVRNDKKCGSSFSINYRPLPEADGNDIVFGEILEGFDALY
jgi:cyclophilin family peptidyl-prolyl cis-trans isomerase